MRDTDFMKNIFRSAASFHKMCAVQVMQSQQRETMASHQLQMASVCIPDLSPITLCIDHYAVTEINILLPLLPASAPRHPCPSHTHTQHAALLAWHASPHFTLIALIHLLRLCPDLSSSRNSPMTDSDEIKYFYMLALHAVSTAIISFTTRHHSYPFPRLSSQYAIHPLKARACLLYGRVH